jgi:hypothetical protein
VVLCWRKRIWRCAEPACGVRTWTEQAAAIRPRAVLTQRARAEACRRVGKDAHAVAAVARDLGVGWATIMRAMRDHGSLLLDDPTRLDSVAKLGLDETAFLKATPTAPTRYVTCLVDLERGRLLDLVADRTSALHELPAPAPAPAGAGDHAGRPRAANSSTNCSSVNSAPERIAGAHRQASVGGTPPEQRATSRRGSA